MAYDATEKAIAVEIVRRHGGLTAEALAEVQRALGKKVGKTTVHSWFKKSGNSEIGTIQKTGTDSEPLEDIAALTLDRMFEKIAQRYLVNAYKASKVEEMDGKALVTAAAIAVDKMRLLRDLPTEIVTVLPDFLQALRSIGYEPNIFIQQVIQKAHDRQLQ